MIYPVVVRRELRSVWGIHIPHLSPIQWGAVRSYCEFPKHLIENTMSGNLYDHWNLRRISGIFKGDVKFDHGASTLDMAEIHRIQRDIIGVQWNIQWIIRKALFQKWTNND